MKYLVYIFLIIVLSCTKSHISDLREEDPVLSAVLKSSDPAQQVRFFSFTDNSSIPLQDAKVTLSDHDILNAELRFDNGVYICDNCVLQPGKTYELTADMDGHSLSASCKIPPELVLEDIDNDTVYTGTTGSLPLQISWNELNTGIYSYLLVLENLAFAKVEVPGAEGNFEERFYGPQLQESISLVKTDFKYFGHHRLTVYAVDRTFESVFFFDAADVRGFLRNGPDNVKGGKGFVTGVSNFVVDFYLLE